MGSAFPPGTSARPMAAHAKPCIATAARWAVKEQRCLIHQSIADIPSDSDAEADGEAMGDAERDGDSDPELDGTAD